jgi:hypothetical protein
MFENHRFGGDLIHMIDNKSYCIIPENSGHPTLTQQGSGYFKNLSVLSLNYYILLWSAHTDSLVQNFIFSKEGLNVVINKFHPIITFKYFVVFPILSFNHFVKIHNSLKHFMFSFQQIQLVHTRKIITYQRHSDFDINGEGPQTST